MQNAALEAMGLDAVYVAFDVMPERLGAALAGLAALGTGGVNVTIPFKEAVIPFLTSLSPEAELIGAVNTIHFVGAERRGHNTDAPGFIRSLRRAGGEPRDARVLLLGAGGSARAVAVSLAREGAALTIVNRTYSRAEELAGLLNARVHEGCARAVPWEARVLGEEMRRAELMVNTTPVGMAPANAECPELPEDGFHESLLVYDLIYNPAETRLLERARRQGCRVINGAGMLAWQGALALEIWTGRAGPADLMEQMLLGEQSPGKSPEPATRVL
jgi:shikimate dehydrogenase